MAQLSSNIALWAYGNQLKIDQVKQWFEDALVAMTNNGGKDVVQTSANSVSVSFSAGMTNEKWLNTLADAIRILESGQFPVKRKQGTFFNDDYL
jgi:hypothetical protein